MKRAGIYFALLSTCFAGAVLLPWASVWSQPPAPAKDAPVVKPKYSTRTLRGRVVWQSEALSRRFGVRSVPEAAERNLVLETSEGVLHPLVEDVRGRAFRADKRLREIDLELVVRQYEGAPVVQVLQVFSLKKGRKHEVDYWCDVCSIAMYELKTCECCQGDITLRERPVED